jgi:hypothetical protein
MVLRSFVEEVDYASPPGANGQVARRIRLATG